MIYKETNQDKIGQLERLSDVVAIHIKEPRTYRNQEGHPMPRPEDFKSKLMIRGFQHNTLSVQNLEELCEGTWLKNLTPAAYNTTVLWTMTI